jgi:hypothetical protein
MFHVLGRDELEATKISSRSWIHLFIVKLQQTRLPAELENPADGQGEMENNGLMLGKHMETLETMLSLIHITLN